VKQLESIKNKIKSFYPSNTTIYKKMNHENIYKEKYDDDVEGVLQRIIQKPVAMASTSLPMKKLQNPILGG
jgi:hypothetical protein